MLHKVGVLTWIYTGNECRRHGRINGDKPCWGGLSVRILTAIYDYIISSYSPRLGRLHFFYGLYN